QRVGRLGRAHRDLDRQHDARVDGQPGEGDVQPAHGARSGRRAADRVRAGRLLRVAEEGEVTIVVGYDGREASERALDRAIAEAAKANAQLVVVAVAEMPLDPEGPQNFGSLDASPPVSLPLVTPPELELLFDKARDKADRANVESDFVWSAGEPSRE